jgi:hypothetical protein
MPITVSQPSTNGPFGPGFQFSVSSDFVGPITGPFWRIDIWDEPLEILLYSMTQGNTGSGNVSTGYFQGFLTTVPAQMKVPTGANVKLKVNLESSTGVVETTSKNIVLDEITGRVMVTYNKLIVIGNQLSGLGGVSTDLADVKLATFATFDPSTVVPLSELLVAPPLGFLHRELISPDRTGEGTLTHPGAPAYGITWEFVDVAAGIGVNEGAPDTLWTHALDLQLVHTLGDSSLETTNRASFDFGDSMWLFDPARPTEVHYWIGPGVTCRFHWLVL